MKRSEMIEKIELALSQIAYAESIDRKKFESDYIAHRILEVCEKAGMLPPTVKDESIQINDVYDLDLMYRNEWENEEK